MKSIGALLLLPLLVACSSTSAPDSGGDQSTGTYKVAAPEVAERVRTYLQSQWYRMSFDNEEKTVLSGFRSTRNHMDRTSLTIACTDVGGGSGLTQVVVTGSSSGGDGVVRQWQMRVHRHLRALYPAVADG